MPELTNTALCELYEVGIYRVGEVFGRYRCGAPIPAEDRNKWFVATPTGILPACEVAGIPLTDSIEEAQGLAVKRLGLRELHRAVCALGRQELRATDFPDTTVTGIQSSRFPTRSFGETDHQFSWPFPFLPDLGGGEMHPPVVRFNETPDSLLPTPDIIARHF